MVKPCTEDGCVTIRRRRGMCEKHYMRFYRENRELIQQESPETPEERIGRGIAIASNGCWLWTGALSDGYGTVRFQGKVWKAHRFSYATYTGSLDNSMAIHHTCRNRACVNPEHLVQVTQAANMIEALAYKADHSNCVPKEQRKPKWPSRGPKPGPYRTLRKRG